MSRVDLKGIGMTSQRTRERLIQRLVDQGISNHKVLDVMATTPRHLFLDEAMAHRAYEDVALPIGFQQTLSQPYIVARMTELLLEGGAPERVLEIGTGSGYQTAILAQLVGEVYSVERIKPLQQKARQRMRQLKLRNVHMNHADGGMGWPERGPFDAILAAAAPERIPEDLLRQLAPGGRLVMPVGGATQHLQIVDRTHEGFETTIVEEVRFVPLRPGTVR
ncbi:protein-L-isoaspartate O-methyltransferase [Halioglobus japonicus]|uniref:Protein-L-isoaspartate O-methyltransferase n=2 Tax=Halioglobus japonicus TaxID=930805 RepID=A0AAP8MGT4_9GAMM|nr:protein-L-isoaspartate(D-aspartate) O-methyltransferase [Halioglobus japonicus]AQA19330.1 protein-L-isoaspartate O-methyltransferase [Halioglobus japonicus]PLW87625.1 protein-L-isoaspartate(D-aspartate) O-methyltransferase [Halioglobus japonicus]